MNSYQSLSRESEIPENEQPLNYAEGNVLKPMRQKQAVLLSG